MASHYPFLKVQIHCLSNFSLCQFVPLFPNLSFRSILSLFISVPRYLDSFRFSIFCVLILICTSLLPIFCKLHNFSFTCIDFHSIFQANAVYLHFRFSNYYFVICLAYLINFFVVDLHSHLFYLRSPYNLISIQAEQHGRKWTCLPHFFLCAKFILQVFLSNLYIGA